MIDLSTTSFPPRDYASACDLIGHTVDTPNGALVCRSAAECGKSTEPDYVLIVSFEGISWTSNLGWLTSEERKAVAWTNRFSHLPKVAQDLIGVVLAEEVTRIPAALRNDPERILREAKRRLVRANKVACRPCGRCGGTGKHSYNRINGDECFSCQGTGVNLPTSMACLLVAVRCEEASA